MRVGKRKEEAPRYFVVVSFSMRDAASEIEQLARQVGNGVDVEFSNFQLALSAPASGGEPAPVHRYIPDEDVPGRCQFCGAEEGAAIHNYQPEIPLEHRSMSVDGEDADVVRAPIDPEILTTGEAAQRLIDEARADVGGPLAPDPIDVDSRAPHPHRPNGQDDACAVCGRPLMDEIHGEGAIAAVRHFFAAKSEDEAEVCGLCGGARDLEVHITEAESDERVAAGARGRRRG